MPGRCDEPSGVCGYVRPEGDANVILATTMWDLVDEPLGAGREQQLQKEFGRTS